MLGERRWRPWIAAFALGAWALCATVAAAAEAGDDVRVFPIEAFVVFEGGEPVVSRDWIDAQVEHANELFAPAGVGFEVEHVWKIPGEYSHVETRADRDALVSFPRAVGRIQVFFVRHLDDVDIPDTRLFGVHWRYRRDREQTWVILSAKDEGSTVLTHELGHLFELGHSRYDASIMNKSPAEETPWSERVFAPPELQRIRRYRRRHIRTGRLVPIADI